ncbi:MAG: hypothetical protein M3Y18_07735 [Candidatus Eremiobacteraeota bacterium]|nr:hypothetical protein [Candidatus Eremiobacteraeota bacterium]
MGLLVTFAVLLLTATPAIAAFDRAFEGITDYQMTVSSREVRGSSVQERTYHYAFLRPHYEKIDILSGEGRGGGAVWIGGESVKGHKGFLSFIHLTRSLHSPDATSLLGLTMVNGLMQNVVDRFKTTAGKLEQHPGPVIDGRPTDEVVLHIADPASNFGIDKFVLDLSRATHFPVLETAYARGVIVLDQRYLEIKINTGLAAGDFPY